MSKVVDFPVRLPEAELFAHEETARLYVHWRQQLRMGRMPRVTDVAPRRLGALTAFSGLVESNGNSVHGGPDGMRLRWRLAGSALCRLAGRQLDGSEAFIDWPRFECATLRRLLGQVVQAQRPFLAQLKLVGGAHPCRMELLALPLLDAPRKRTVALLMFRPFHDPARIVAGRLQDSRLTSLRILPAGERLDQGEAAHHDDGEAGKVLPLFGMGHERA